MKEDPVVGTVAAFLLDIVPYCKEILEKGYVYKPMNREPVMKDWVKKTRKRRSDAQIAADRKGTREGRFEVEDEEEEEEEEDKEAVEEECVQSQSDELSLRFSLLYILLIRIMGCDLVTTGISLSFNIPELESVVVRRVFDLEEIVDVTNSINLWRVNDSRLDLALGGSNVYYHDHVASLFRHLPDLTRLCFDVTKWSLKPTSSLLGKVMKGAKSDVETRNWVKSLMHQTISVWSTIMKPGSSVEFGDLMFKAIGTQPSIRNGHVLTRFTDSASFHDLDRRESIRISDARTTSTRFISKKQKERVIKPSLYNASPEKVRELVQTPQYKAVSAALGPQPQAPGRKTRQANRGLAYESIALVDNEGVRNVLTDEDVKSLSMRIASLKKTVGLVSNGVDKLSARLYRSHVAMCSGVNGDLIKYLKGLLLF